MRGGQAKDFLVQQTFEQAQREGIALSEEEVPNREREIAAENCRLSERTEIRVKRAPRTWIW